ncbi:MAG: leucine-rich repeat domain-containing protein [Myxococcota bacterium]
MPAFRFKPIDVGPAAVAPFRLGDAVTRRQKPAELIDAIRALKAPLKDALQAELIAIAWVHPESPVRKAAMKQVKAHVPDAADFSKAYKSLAGKSRHIVEERVRAFDHKLRLPITKAMAFHALAALSIPFEEDTKFRKAFLERAAKRAERETKKVLELGQIYWTPNLVSTTDFHTLPAALFRELGALRKTHSFTGLSIHGSSLTELPSELKKTKSWIKTLTLNFGDFATFPEAVLELTNLEELYIAGTLMTDIPPGIAKLKKLRVLDIGNQKKMKTIPESVCALDRLETLRIGNGSIRSIPPSIAGMKSLRVLSMRSTKISRLPPEMADLPSLKVLRIYFSKLSKEKAKAALPKGVKIEG